MMTETERSLKQITRNLEQINKTLEKTGERLNWLLTPFVRDINKLVTTLGQLEDILSEDLAEPEISEDEEDELH